MENTEKSKTIQLQSRIESFHKRWSIDLSDDERWDEFRVRTINSFMSTLYIEFERWSKIDLEFCSLVGIHQAQMHDAFTGLITKPTELATYNFFIQERNHKKFFFGIEALSWMEKTTGEARKKFLEEVKLNINITGIPVEFKITNNEITTYPAGAKLLDERLVNDNLDWLIEYPNVYKLFTLSLSRIGVKGKEREVLDNLRLSLETLLKEILGNSKSLEKQKSELGGYLKTQGISTEISNLFWQVLDYYTKYQNNNVKHSDNVNPDEVEFLLYLTGTMMRLILKHTELKQL